MLADRRGHAARALPEPLWLEWLALGGVLAFATWLLGVRGVWGLLLRPWRRAVSHEKARALCP